jgi:hypothetical protein
LICNRDLENYVGCGKRLPAVLCLVIISLWIIHPASTGYAQSAAPAEEKKEAVPQKKKDTKSGGRWLPIPIFITEPAVGYGLGLALGYIHPAKNQGETVGTPTQHSLDSVSSGRTGQKPPPTITAVGGGYTAKGTWAAAVAHSTSWRQDTIRYAGGLLYFDVKSTYYIVDQSLDFNLRGGGLYQDIKFRLGDSRWFLGGKLAVLDTKSNLGTNLRHNVEIAVDEITMRNVGVAAEATYDSRDNVFTPNAGQLLQLDAWRYDEGLGGNFNYWKGKLKALSFHQLHAKFVLGLRLELEAIDGRAPFYAHPWIKLRGIPALRYQGRRTDTVEIEGRWNFIDRWALLGFAGTGAVHFGRSSSYDIVKSDIYAGGMGARYFMMKDLGLWLGVDVARGPEDWYTYITVGQAW